MPTTDQNDPPPTSDGMSGHGPRPTARTPRLALRPFTPADADAVLACLADAPAPPTPDDVRRGLARLADAPDDGGDRCDLAVTLAENGALVGWIPLTLRADATGVEAEIGWAVASAHRGRGYASEAARAVVAWAFDTRGVRRVWALCPADNPASARVARAVGLEATPPDRADGAVVYALCADARRGARESAAAREKSAADGTRTGAGRV